MASTIPIMAASDNWGGLITFAVIAGIILINRLAHKLSERKRKTIEKAQREDGEEGEATPAEDLEAWLNSLGRRKGPEGGEALPPAQRIAREAEARRARREQEAQEKARPQARPAPQARPVPQSRPAQKPRPAQTPVATIIDVVAEETQRLIDARRRQPPAVPVAEPEPEPSAALARSTAVVSQQTSPAHVSLDLLHKPEGLRSAFVYAVVMGPPRARMPMRPRASSPPFLREGA